MIKLSICMMVKDEEENIRRCLDSLSPLMKSIPSELIIVDTGSKDQTVEIAKKYTDKIYYHQWNNNFSEMRNISIGYAKGEWIFIIDADEEVSQTKGICSFINKKKKSNITAGAVKLINVKQNDKNKFATVLLSPRLFLNNGKFKYEGIVHNIPVVEGFSEEINSTIYHYGYNSNDPELMEKKFKRTSSLLIQELVKNPNNIYYRYQLSVTYHMHHDVAKALIEAKIAYDLIQKSDEDMRKYAYVYLQLEKCYLMNEYYEETIKIADETLALEPEYFDAYFFKAHALLLLGKDREGIDSYLNYLSLIKRYDQLSIRLNLKIQTSSNSQESLHEAYHNMAVTYYKLNDYDMALEYASKIIKDRTDDNSYAIRILPLYIEVSYKLSKYELIINLINKIESINIQELCYKNTEKLISIDNIESIKAFAKLKNSYGMLNALRYENSIGNITSIQILNQLIKETNFNTCLEGYYELLYYAMKASQEITHLLMKYSEEKLIDIINVIDKKFLDFPQIVVVYLQSLEYQVDFKVINSKRLFYKFLMFKTNGMDSKSIFCKEYLNAGIDFIRMKYAKDFLCLSDKVQFITSEESFLIMINRILSIENEEERYKQLNEEADNYPEMQIVINYLQQRWKEDINRHNELESLEEELISQVERLIDEGDMYNAKSILDQAIEIIPNSVKLRDLKQYKFN